MLVPRVFGHYLFGIYNVDIGVTYMFMTFLKKNGQWVFLLSASTSVQGNMA